MLLSKLNHRQHPALNSPSSDVTYTREDAVNLYRSIRKTKFWEFSVRILGYTITYVTTLKKRILTDDNMVRLVEDAVGKDLQLMEPFLKKCTQWLTDETVRSLKDCAYRPIVGEQLLATAIYEICGAVDPINRVRFCAEELNILIDERDVSLDQPVTNEIMRSVLQHWCDGKVNLWLFGSNSFFLLTIDPNQIKAMMEAAQNRATLFFREFSA